MLNPNSSPEQAAGKLHDVAMAAEKNLEQLATGMGQIGADPRAVKAVSQMAEVTRKIATGLAKNGVADQQAPPEQPAQPQHHTIHSATEAMMADARAQQAQQ